MIKRLFITTLLLFVSSQLWAQDSCVAPQTPEDFRSYENILYKDSLGMDLYLPTHGENFPVAFIVHGGSWIRGKRQDFNPFAKQLTAMGYAAVTVSYRLAKMFGGRFPAPVEDLRCAVKTLRRLAGKYSLDTDHIMGMGTSAGAHLVAELALTNDNDAFNDSKCPVQNFGSEIQSVIAYYGPYDLRKTEGLNFGQIGIISNFLGGLPLFKKRQAELASPVAQIDHEDVPFYLVQASNDNLVPVRSSREFNQALREANRQVKFIETTDGAHTLKYFDERDFAKEATCETLDTLRKFALESRR